MRCSVLIVDDPGFRAQARAVLAAAGYEVVGEAADGESGVRVAGQAGDAGAIHAVVEREDPDVVVTDIRMRPTNSNDGLLAAQRIRAEHPGTGVLVLSQYVETRQAIKLLQHSPALSATCSRTGCPTSRNSPMPSGGSPGADR